MKLNKKGFMMAEVVVVSAVILGVLVSIYSSYSKVFRRYSEVLNYYNVDGVYKLVTVRDKMIGASRFSNINFVLNYTDSLGVGYFKCTPEICLTNDNVYFIKKSKLNAIINNSETGMSDSFKEYLSYLRNAVTFSSNGNYIMVIEWPRDDETNYYNYLELEA